MAIAEGTRLIQISEQMDALALERSRVLAAFEEKRGYHEYGCPNTVAFLKVHCRMGTAAAMELQSVARRLPELPRVEEAVAAGEIGFQHAAVIAESADKLGSESLLDHQTALVEKAEEVDPSRLRQEVKKVEFQVDEERAKREAEWAYRSRDLRHRQLKDGRGQAEWMMDPETYSSFKVALNAALGPRAKDEKRNEGQRRSDAMLDLLHRALRGGRLGKTGGQVPHLNITVELETLLRLRDNPGSIAGAGPALYETIERHLCDAAVCITVLDENKVLLAGRERRTFSGPLRRALTLKKQTCDCPGCDRPAEWCEGHHLLSWVLGGKTLPEEGALLCRYHHRLVHEGGWTFKSEAGEFVLTSPSGEKFRSAKAPPAA